MKKSLSFYLTALLLSVICSYTAEAQEVKNPNFKIIVRNPVTPVKNQYQSGTCWDYATTALMESEAIRINGITNPAKYPDFSEMFTVSKSYQERLVKYVRVGGHLSTGPGSLAPDLLHIVADYGIVPQNAMPGKTELPVLRDMDKKLAKLMKYDNEHKEVLTCDDWKAQFLAVLDSTIGPCPESFVVDGIEYTPASYRDHFKLNADDYVTISSFTHVPFYRTFITDVPDNWRWDTAYNVPLDELMQTMTYAVENGYTFAWDADMTEETWFETGIAYMPDDKVTVTQESRQRAYDIKETVDDHLMQVYGIAIDQAGNKYFVVKNSWGTESGKYGGDWYATEQYVAAKTIQITLHKDAVPQEIRSKLGF